MGMNNGWYSSGLNAVEGNYFSRYIQDKSFRPRNAVSGSCKTKTLLWQQLWELQKRCALGWWGNVAVWSGNAAAAKINILVAKHDPFNNYQKIRKSKDWKKPNWLYSKCYPFDTGEQFGARSDHQPKGGMSFGILGSLYRSLNTYYLSYQTNLYLVVCKHYITHLLTGGALSRIWPPVLCHCCEHCVICNMQTWTRSIISVR